MKYLLCIRYTWLRILLLWKLLDAFVKEQQNVWFSSGRSALYHGPREMIFQENMPKEVIAVFSMNIKTKFTLSAETVRPRLTRWFWNFSNG